MFGKRIKLSVLLAVCGVLLFSSLMFNLGCTKSLCNIDYTYEFIWK
ncbi:hypothetical protein ACJDT4_12925 [Clostridium neuense]|uniref:Cyclic lactone autoinducer peptide n=1 Tax=Clostridium neuense TaxID=1728934 RepID=A0ABW8TFZ5_9CLOT